MKTIEIIGYKRANLGKTESKRLRAEGNVPCVVYGGPDEQIHFHSPMILFRDLVYTNEARFVNLNIEGVEKRCILKDIQFHPVNEIILHADFYELKAGKIVKMDIPVRMNGTAPGIQKGGKLVVKVRKLAVQALPKDMPEYIEVNVEKLDLGKSVKVGEVETNNFEIMNSPLVTIASVEVPRSLRGADGEEEDEDEDGEESTEGASAEAES
ncbi:MAG: 50S ribosomal protein L25/general stress protein Ctc [Cyclobacteriaceae bacterium]